MRSSLLSHCVVGCVGILIGAVVAPFLRQQSASVQPPASRPSSGSEPVVASHGDAGALDETLRRIIREEFSRHDTVGPAGSMPAAPSPVIDTVDASEVSAYLARANAVLDAAITRQSWTNTDASELRRVMAVVPAAERQALMLKFARAVNEQNMHLETDGPPF